MRMCGEQGVSEKELEPWEMIDKSIRPDKGVVYIRVPRWSTNK